MSVILTEIMDEMRSLLAQIAVDLKKAANGNRAASQRVRVDTIELEKMAKCYRKESIAVEKKIIHKKLSSGKKSFSKKTGKRK